MFMIVYLEDYNYLVKLKLSCEIKIIEINFI